MSIHLFQLRERTPLSAVTWESKLREADDEHEVIAIVREFVARFDPQEIDALPAVCRPGKFFVADDVAAFALSLAQHHCGDTAGAEELVHKLSAFFSEASNRLTQILRNDNSSEGDTRQSA